MQFKLRKTTMTKRAVSSAATFALIMLLATMGATPTRADHGGSSGSGGGSGSGSSGSGSSGSGGGGGTTTGPLSSVPVPVPANLGSYVTNQQALVALGKALFWDMQTGNDGKQACASCHFHAGADHRSTNQTNPHGGSFTPNSPLSPADFPYSSSTARQVAGSAGVFPRNFNNVVTGSAVDDSTPFLDSTFQIGGVGVRRVTGRNTPTVINAVFNVRNFWDGRANNNFTVFSPFGNSNPSSIWVKQADGSLLAVNTSIPNSSLASQSVGPPNNGTEMSSAGRDWPELGKKMLSLTPLANQRVASTDSVLGAYANPSGTGLSISYPSMIQQAFADKYWSSTQLVTDPAKPANQYTQMQYNFALFWGLAIQAYESTLVSSASPYDQFAAGNKSALTAQQVQGLSVFLGKGGCATCHSGAEFTSAAYSTINKLGPVEGLAHGLQTDTGFFHTGVRPSSEDPGLNNVNGVGFPLPITTSTAGVNGAFKTPSVRNTEFTGPYFHNGGASTLEQVVDFYNRGGNTPGDLNLGPNIKPLGLSASDSAALVAFMKSLSDDRLRFEKAPFDHPQLCVPNGEQQVGGVLMIGPNFTSEAADNMVEIAEVGAAGGPQLQTFAELIGASAANGPRAHDLKTACTMH